MVDVNRLRAAWVAKGYRQSDVALLIGVSNKTLSLRMKKGVFGSEEIEKLVEVLEIENPMDIFFAK